MPRYSTERKNAVLKKLLPPENQSVPEVSRSEEIIGACRADPSGNTSDGESYVVFGGSGVASIDLSSLDGSDGFVPIVMVL